MALPKLYDRIIWHNNTTPALNEDNLNAMSQALDDIDDRVIDLAGTIMEDVPQILEDMAILGPAIESIDDNVAAAEADKLESEGFAVGEQNGVPVDSSSPYYHNNAKYYSTVASGSSAAHITYNNSDSHLAATNVQTAIDEVAGDLADEVKARAILGAHQFLKPPYFRASGYLHNGITFTYGSDGIITANGTLGLGNEAQIIMRQRHESDNADLVTFLKNNACKIILDTTDNNAEVIIEFYDSSQTFITEASIITKNTALINVPNSAVYTNILAKVYNNEDNVALKVTICLACDNYTGYTAPAMTNKELTDSKADKSDLASISITGTTNNTGATIASGTYFYLNGALVKAKTSIANGATLTANTNYVAVTVGGLADIGNLLVGVNKKPYTYQASTNNFEFYPEKYSAYIIMAMTSSNTGYGLWYCIRLNDYMVCIRLDYGSYDFVSVTVDATNKKVTMAGTYNFVVNVIGVFEVA